jgi:hypothetical protein
LKTACGLAAWHGNDGNNFYIFWGVVIFTIAAGNRLPEIYLGREPAACIRLLEIFFIFFLGSYYFYESGWVGVG